MIPHTFGDLTRRHDWRRNPDRSDKDGVWFDCAECGRGTWDRDKPYVPNDCVQHVPTRAYHPARAVLSEAAQRRMR